MPRRPGLLALALASVLFIGAEQTVATPWRIEGRSMEPEIVDGSYLLVDRLGPGLTGYERGDVVILSTPAEAGFPLPYLIKRVVGVPGERVQVFGGTVLVDGEPLPEPYLPSSVFDAPDLAGLRFDAVVPPGQVFVLGDRRSNSLDSASFGPVPIDALHGRVWLIVGPERLAIPHGSPDPATVRVSW